jgi:hypothetical protein
MGRRVGGSAGRRVGVRPYAQTPTRSLGINEFALKLKGREADLIKLAPIAALKLECAIERCYMPLLR